MNGIMPPRILISTALIALVFNGIASSHAHAEVITFDGDLTLGPDNVVEIRIGGNIAGTEHDFIVVTGHADLAGTLSLFQINGFNPDFGDTFQIMTFGSRNGAFDRVVKMFELDGFAFAPLYSAVDLTLFGALPGDGNLDGIVNFNDFVIITDNFSISQPSWTQGDYNSDGVVNFEDFVVLSNHYELAVLTSAAIPEPSMIALAGLGLLCMKWVNASGARPGKD